MFPQPRCSPIEIQKNLDADSRDNFSAVGILPPVSGHLHVTASWRAGPKLFLRLNRNDSSRHNSSWRLWHYRSESWHAQPCRGFLLPCPFPIIGCEQCSAATSREFSAPARNSGTEKPSLLQSVFPDALPRRARSILRQARKRSSFARHPL